MGNTSHWKLRGPVRTLRIEMAEWDAAGQDWQPARFFQFVAFGPDGRVVQLDQRGVEGSVFRTVFSYDSDGRLRETQAGTADAEVAHRVVYAYDDTGRPLSVTEMAEDGIERLTHSSTFDEQGDRTTTHVLPPAVQNGDAFGIDGSEIAYGAPGVKTITTSYDVGDRSREVIFQDASGAIIRRITLTRDGEGRVVTEEAQNVGPFVLPDSPAPGSISAEDFEQMQALVSHVFGTIRTTYEYDAGGRLISSTQHMGLLGEERIAYTYDERGNPTSELHESVNREMQLNAEGGPTSSGDTKRMQEIRFSYEYDARGNWTQRIARSRFTSNAEFEPANSNMERRTIEYYNS